MEKIPDTPEYLSYIRKIRNGITPSSKEYQALSARDKRRAGIILWHLKRKKQKENVNQADVNKNEIELSKECDIKGTPELLDIDRELISKNMYLDEYMSIFDDLKAGRIKKFKDLVQEDKKEFISIFSIDYQNQIDIPSYLCDSLSPEYYLRNSEHLKKVASTLDRIFKKKEDTKPGTGPMLSEADTPRVEPLDPGIAMMNAARVAARIAIEENNLELFITQRNFAKRVGVCRTTVANWVNENLIPIVRPPGCNRTFILYPEAVRVVRSWATTATPADNPD